MQNARKDAAGVEVAPVAHTPTRGWCARAAAAGPPCAHTWRGCRHRIIDTPGRTNHTPTVEFKGARNITKMYDRLSPCVLKNSKKHQGANQVDHSIKLFSYLSVSYKFKEKEHLFVKHYGNEKANQKPELKRFLSFSREVVRRGRVNDWHLFLESLSAAEQCFFR